MIAPIKHALTDKAVAFSIPVPPFISSLAKQKLIVQFFKKDIFSTTVYAIHADVFLNITSFGVGYFRRYKMA